MPMVGDGSRLGATTGILIFCTAVVFAVLSFGDMYRFVMLYAQRSQQEQVQSALPDDAVMSKEAFVSAKAHKELAERASTENVDQRRWSILAIVGLTSYRFYTGFLSATWLPYLLAMEGEDLWHEQQAMFMGIAKLIYGGTILMNPIFGQVGDQAVALSHGVGRRLFVRAGVTTAALGIYLCILSAREHAFLSFLSGILVWRLGEAMNDVTTEALVPEMVPQEQYHVASGIKACSFLLGGLFGYAILLVFSDVHYSWLYYAYPIGMFSCAVPSIILLDRDHPFPPAQQHKRPEADGTSEDRFGQSLAKAYLTPIRLKGGFPRACLAVFIFSLGTTPMFFLLLIVRDLVGIEDPIRIQQHFSAGSISFFLSAAVASVLASTLAGGKKPVPRPAAEGRAWADAEALQKRGRLLVASMVTFGVIVLVIPALSLLTAAQARDRAFYTLTALFGASFGISFSLFQDLTWQMLPPEVDFANAMGFNVMSRLLGVGLGNFVCGLILDLHKRDMWPHANGSAAAGYNVQGYVIMCVFSGLAVLLSSAVARSAIGLAERARLQDPSNSGCPAPAAA